MSRADLSRGRTAQKQRTRSALMDAAVRLVTAGRPITIEDVAQEADVSRATAYRYFTSPDALLNEAHLHRQVAAAKDLFPDDSGSAVERVIRVSDHLLDLAVQNETAFRQLLRGTMGRALADDGSNDAPLRGGRRIDLFEKALQPVRRELGTRGFRRLVDSLAMIVGAETYFAGRDICHLERPGIRRNLRWMVTALVESSLGQARRKT